MVHCNIYCGILNQSEDQSNDSYTENQGRILYEVPSIRNRTDLDVWYARWCIVSEHLAIRTEVIYIGNVQVLKLSLGPRRGREEVRGTTVQAGGEIPPGVMPRKSAIETDSRWLSQYLMGKLSTGDRWNGGVRDHT